MVERRSPKWRVATWCTSVLSVALVACSDDGSNEGSSGRKRDSDAELTDAGVDKAGGRDEAPSSCFAACQNSFFTCQTKVGSKTTITQVDLVLEGAGCEGTLTEDDGSAVPIELNCTRAEVCIGSSSSADCLAATFSALSFAYPSDDDALTICTRN